MDLLRSADVTVGWAKRDGKAQWALYDRERDVRDLDSYLDVAGCEGQARESARALAPPGYAADYYWYLLRRT